MVARDRCFSRWCTAVGASTALVVVALAPLATARPEAAAASAHQEAGDSSCAAVVTRTVAPDSIRKCEASTVTLAVRADCVRLRQDIVFIIDLAYAPRNAQEEHRRYTRVVPEAIDLDALPHIRAGVVWMMWDGKSARMAMPLGHDARRFKDAMSPPLPLVIPEGKCYSCAFNRALGELKEAQRDDEVLGAAIYIGGPPMSSINGTFGFQVTEWNAGTARVKGRRTLMVVGCPFGGSCTGWSWNPGPDPH